MSIIPRRLNAQLILLVSATLLVTGVVSGWVTARNQSDKLIAAMRKESAIMVRNLAENSARFLVLQDFAGLESFLLKSSELPDIQGLQVCEPDGTLVGDVEHESGKRPRAKPGTGRITPPSSRSPVMAAEDGLLVIWQPIEAGDMLGWIKAAYSMSGIREAQAETLRNSLFLALIWVACSAVMLLLVLRPTVREFSRLTQFALQLDEHKGAHIVVGHRTLEIDELAASLNYASERLFTTEQQLVSDRERLRESEAELEQRVIERTAQLEASNREMAAFAYSVSHDLRTPLRGIDGFSQMLMDEYPSKLDEQGRDYLQRIRAATKRMDRLIDDMLALSRITRAEMKREQVDLSALARSVADELQQAEPERRVEFVIQGGLTTRGDKRLLLIVLENLLGNAWKFTGSNAAARIEFGAVASGTGATYFIRDDGAGFDMAYADKLFVPFQRLHGYGEFIGTGIGLSIVQRIIHRHGGEIRAEGAVGQGATVYFTLK